MSMSIWSAKSEGKSLCLPGMGVVVVEVLGTIGRRVLGMVFDDWCGEASQSADDVVNAKRPRSQEQT